MWGMILAFAAGYLLREFTRPYDQWIGKSDDGPKVLWIKNLIHVRRFRLDLHKFVDSDDPGCFHTHPAKAFRIILWGGYWEEVYVPLLELTGLEHGERDYIYFRTYLKKWTPGMTGFITPEFCHRIAAPLNKRTRVSYSLWLRWPVTHPIHLIGNGWPPEKRSYPSPLDDEQTH